MAKKRNIIQPLSDFEHDGIWMSYRYCIGRKSISSHARAGDILSNCYERLKLTPERCEFMAFDICRSIEDNLRWGQLNVYIENNKQLRHVYPLDEVLNAISDKDGYFKAEDLNNIKKINIIVHDYGNVEYNIERDENHKNHYPIMDLEDLMVWQDCAKMLDLSQHKMCKMSFPEGEKYVEYVELYRNIREENGKDRIVKRKVPVDKYIRNNVFFTYLNENYIIEDNLIVNEELLKNE